MRKVKELLKDKKIISILIVLSLLILIYLFSRGCNKDMQVTYDFVEITKGEVKKTISASGTLQVIDTYVIMSKITGVVNKLYTDFNKNVKKNQLLAQLNSPGIGQNIMKAAAHMDYSKLQMKSALREFEGKKNLFKDNLISKKELEMAEIKYKTVSSKHRQIQIDYNIALRDKRSTRVVAPESGVVISRDVQPHSPVGVGTVLFKIAKTLKKMMLVINIDETDMGHIKKGLNVFFTVSAFPRKSFTGRINQVRFNPVHRGGVVTYQSVVICDNSEILLKPGMTATATVVVASKKDIIRVPNQCFIISPVEVEKNTTKKFIWLESSFSVGKFPMKRFEVKTGLEGDTNTEIISKNIKLGEKVLIGIRKDLGVKDEVSSYGK